MGEKRDEFSQQVRHQVELAKIGAQTVKEIAVVAAPLLGNPSLAPVVMSPKVGQMTEKAVVWVTEFGHASTGAWIKGLKGAARTDSVLARLGGGTLANGGWGRAGGAKVLAAVGTGATVFVLGTWLVHGAIAINIQAKDAAERASTPVVLCAKCQEALSLEADGAETTVCPRCGHATDQE